jgi:hypothetical protein
MAGWLGAVAEGLMEERSMDGQEFEFTAAQNETIRVLAHRMKWVAVFQIVSGIGLAIGGIASFANAQEGFALILTAVLFVVIGIYTYSASKSFLEIVETTGADITHLMEAVSSLKSLYNIQFWLIIAYLVIIGIIVLIAIFAAFLGS